MRQPLVDAAWLETFVATAEAQQLGLAAKRLHLTQPALSRQIARLEQHCGTALFVRTGRGMALTAAGEALLPRAQSWVNDLARLPDALRQPTALAGSVAIGVPLTFGTHRLVELLLAFRRLHPEVELKVSMGLSDRIAEGLAQGRFDLGVLHRALPGTQLLSQPLYVERLWCLGSRSAGLSAKRAVALGVVLRQPLLLPPPGNSLRWLLETEAARRGLRLRLALELDNLPLLYAAARSGMGWAVQPHGSFSEALSGHQLTAAPIHRPVLKRSAFVAHSPARMMSAAARALSEHLAAASYQT